MATIKLIAGTLSPPACYESEQQRFEAYVAKILATILGGTQWETQQIAPIDLGMYWLRQNSDLRARGPRSYNTTDARWVPWLEIPIWPDSSGGVANAYTATTGHALVTAAVRLTGRRIYFIAEADNSGASTLDVDGTGAVPIVRHGGESTDPGDIVEGGIYDVIFNAEGGGRWELATPVPPSEELPNYIESAEFSIPAPSSAVEISHGGGKLPFTCRVVAVCHTAVDGYTVDEELDIGGISADFDPSSEDGAAYLVSVTDDKLNVACCTSTDGMTYPKRTGGNADWLAAKTNFSFKAYLMFLP